MDEPAFPGCLIRCRMIGVIEGKQTTSKNKSIRNDRLIAVAEESHEHRKVRSASDLPAYLIKETENFFAAYQDLDSHTFEASGCCGPRRAAKLVHKGAKGFDRRDKRKEVQVSTKRA